MEYARSTDLRRHLGRYIERIEQGESLILIHRGKPIARITPFEPERRKEPTWKRPIEAHELRGRPIGETLRDERDT